MASLVRTLPARRRWRDLLAWLPVGLVLLLGLAAPFGAHSRLADLLSQFLLQGTVLALLLLPILLWRRQRLAALLTATALVLQLWQMAPGLPLPAHAAAPGLRVLFFNLYRDNSHQKAVAEWIEKLDPDVVVVAEAVSGWHYRLGRLATLFPYRQDCLDRAGCDVAMLSRHPFQNGRSLIDERRAFALPMAEILTTIGPLRIAGIHLSRPLSHGGSLWEQIQQSRFIVDQLAGSRQPTLLVGDFNAVPWGRIVRGIERETGLRALTNLEGTWPSLLPWPLRLPIDQVLASPGLGIQSREVIYGPGSDHRAVLVTLAAEPTSTETPRLTAGR